MQLMKISASFSSERYRLPVQISDLSWGDFIGSALLVLGTSLLIWYWQAAYNGNNTVTAGPREL